MSNEDPGPVKLVNNSLKTLGEVQATLDNLKNTEIQEEIEEEKVKQAKQKKIEEVYPYLEDDYDTLLEKIDTILKKGTPTREDVNSIQSTYRIFTKKYPSKILRKQSKNISSKMKNINRLFNSKELIQTLNAINAQTIVKRENMASMDYKYDKLKQKYGEKLSPKNRLNINTRINKLKVKVYMNEYETLKKKVLEKRLQQDKLSDQDKQGIIVSYMKIKELLNNLPNNLPDEKQMIGKYLYEIKDNYSSKFKFNIGKKLKSESPAQITVSNKGNVRPVENPLHRELSQVPTSATTPDAIPEHIKASKSSALQKTQRNLRRKQPVKSIPKTPSSTGSTRKNRKTRKTRKERR